MASPTIDENIELSNRPINYLAWRLKALIKQERQALMYLSTKSAPVNVNNPALDKNLDVPTGAIKEDTTFSQKTFMIGANQKIKATNLLNLQLDSMNTNGHKKKVKINSEMLKNAMMTRGIDEE